MKRPNKTAISVARQRFAQPYGRVQPIKGYSKTGGVSRTQPNQTLTPREILLRYTRGVPSPTREGSYNDDYIPDIDRMDLVEQDEVMQQNADYISSLKAEREAQAAKAREPLSDSSGVGASSSEAEAKRSESQAQDKGDRAADTGK